MAKDTEKLILSFLTEDDKKTYENLPSTTKKKLKKNKNTRKFRSTYSETSNIRSVFFSDNN